jgi:hypothetical protein
MSKSTFWLTENHKNITFMCQNQVMTFLWLKLLKKVSENVFPGVFWTINIAKWKFSGTCHNFFCLKTIFYQFVCKFINFLQNISVFSSIIQHLVFKRKISTNIYNFSKGCGHIGQPPSINEIKFIRALFFSTHFVLKLGSKRLSLVQFRWIINLGKINTIHCCKKIALNLDFSS